VENDKEPTNSNEDVSLLEFDMTTLHLLIEDLTMNEVTIPSLHSMMVICSQYKYSKAHQSNISDQSLTSTETLNAQSASNEPLNQQPLALQYLPLVQRLGYDEPLHINQSTLVGH
jgi:hypothetical protein